MNGTRKIALMWTVGCLPVLAAGLRSGTANAAPVAAPQKIILDTDIGDDIDDAYALVLVASQPNVKLVGVTTTFGQTAERAELAAKLLHILGHDEVPVAAGRRGTAKIGRQYEWAHGFKAKSLRAEPAVDFLKTQLDAAPGEITLVAIGALTNVGDLLTKYPEVKTKIKRVCIMGGAVYVGYNNQAPPTPEWNIKCDPAAARALFDSGVPVVMAGLEVTTMMQLDEERRRKIYAYGTPATDALAALTALWGNGNPTLYDPVAVAYALGHSPADSEQKHIAVDDNGLTRITDGPATTTVLIHPRKEEFLDWYVSAVKP